MENFHHPNGMPKQDTPETRAYKAFMTHIRNVMRGVGTKEELAEWAEKNAHLASVAETVLKDLRPQNVHVDEVLKTMSVMFANDELIGDRIMPIIFNDGKLSAVYFEYDKRDRTAYPDDTMTDRAEPNELSQNRSTKTIGLVQRALKEYIDQYTIQNQSAPLNEIVDVVENVLYGLAFRRELRVIRACTTPANFGSNTISIAAGDRWDTATGGDPGAVVDAAMESVWSGSGPGRWVLVMSLSVYNVLKRHPRILDTFKALGQPMSATRQMLAEYFEVDEVLVGKARNDTANIGQTASYSRMWPDIVGLFRVAQSPSIRNAAFGYTFQDAPTQQDLQFRLEMGSKGVWQARASHADVQQVIAPECGFLVQNPIN